MYQPRRRIPLPLLGALGLIVGLGAAALISMPRVMNLAPSPDATGALAAPTVSITFSQEMRRETVEARFSVDPERSGAFRWNGKRMTFTPSEPWPEGQEVSIALAAGAASMRGLPMLGGVQWSFTIGAARLVYLWPAGASADLYLWSPAGGAPSRLTETEGGILDYSVTPDGTGIVYSASTADGSEVWLLDIELARGERLFPCPAGRTCRNPALSPDGNWIAYEQDEPQQAAGDVLRRVWVRAMAGGDPYLVAAEDHPSSQLAWSSKGSLVVYDHALMAYALYDSLGNGQAQLAFVVPNGLGDPVAWSPDGESFVFPEIVFPPEDPEADSERPPQFYSHLRRVMAADGSLYDLSGSDTFLVEDAGPAFSSDGRWLAFSRRGLAPETWTPGRQVWRMRPDGSEPLSLTESPGLNHAAVTWSPDGRRIAYMIFDQLNPTRPATIGWRWADGRDGGPVAVPLAEPAAGGYAPSWIP